MTIDQQNTLIHQYRFAFADPRIVKHPAIVGGFGCGKTRAIPLRWLRLVDWRAREQKLKAKLMIVEPTYQMVRDVLVPEMNEFFGHHKIKTRYHKSNHDYTIRLNGHDFTAMLRSADNPASLTGKTVTDAIIDEFDKINSISDQRETWTEVVARIRKAEHGTAGIVTTPEGFKYTHELWVEKNSTNPSFELIKARTADNHFLPHDYIQNLIQQYDSQLAKQYLEGEFVNLSNSMAYYCFKRDLHVIQTGHRADQAIYIGIDFNVNPMTAVVIQLDGGKYRVVSEYFLPNSNTRALAQLISQDWRGYAVYCCPDMTGGNRKTSADMTDLQILESFGFQILGSRNIPERARLNFVNNALDKSRLLISSKCVKLINDLEKVTTNDYGQIAKEKDSKLTHISDALGYVIVALENKPGNWRVV